MICDRCFKMLADGDHGIGVCPFEPRSGHRVKPDTILGGFWAENAWREPRYFESQKQYLKALDQSGLMLKEKKPTHSRVMDPYTLAAAQALVARQAARGTSAGIDVRTLDETLTVRADA